MPTERHPSKAPLQNIPSPNIDSPQSQSQSQSSQFSYTSTSSPSRARQPSPDSDEDIGALLSQKGYASIKPSVRQDLTSKDGLPSSTSRPTLGHPKMMSSRKQKADPFIRQKTRPEHHGAVGGGNSSANKIQAPKGPMYEAKRAPPMPKYDSNFFTGSGSTSATASTAGSGVVRSGSNNVFAGGKGSKYDQETFYVDPEKAQADLKDLLEGGLGEEDEEDLAEKDTETAQDKSKAAKIPEEKKPEDPQAEKNRQLKAEAAQMARRDGTVEGLKVKLLPHQVAGVRWMRGRELGPVKQGKVPKGGILADDMGLGKTLQTISLILTNRKPAKEDPSYNERYDRIEKTTLVVAPLALIRQWESEIKTKVEKKTGLKVLVHHGPQRTKRFKDLALYDVVVTTYQILVSDHGASSDKIDGVQAGCFGLHWWRVVLDEAHTIKNRHAKSTKACYSLRSEFRWCLSGTPMQNNLDELQSLVKFLRIKPYDDYREWKDQIDRPMKNGRGHIAIQRIHSLLHCFMKRRTKEILKKDGALNPGGAKTEEGKESSTGFRVTERKVVTVACELSNAERKFYDRVEARANNNVQHMMNNKINYASAFTLLLRLRQACNHPKLVEGKMDKDKEAWSSNDPAGKRSDADVDGMIDMFSNMGVALRNCTICATQLSKDRSQQGYDHCDECAKDLEFFHNPNKKEKKSKKSKETKVKKVERQTKTTKPARRIRNRNAVVDSDDEEEGSWLVPENERGPTNLGKAGGFDDENAEGGGDTILSEDRSDYGDDKDLSGFVVGDEVARKEKGYKSADEASDSDDSDDSLLSISALTQQMAAQTLDDGKRDTVSEASDVEDDNSAEDDSDESEESSESDDESGIDASELYDSDEEFATGKSYQESRLLASAKIRELINILNKEVAEHKFIVFSQFTSMLDLVQPFLRKRGFKYTRYDGSMKNDEREESLRRLREEKKTRILLCSLKCGSLGLNLTAATRVVILEPFWNPVSDQMKHFPHFQRTYLTNTSP